MYTLGIITGLLIALIIIGVEVLLKRSNKPIVQTIIKKIDKATREKGVMIDAPSDAVEGMKERIEKADNEGKDIPIEKLLP